MKENPIRSLPGIPVLLAVLAVLAACAYVFYLVVMAAGSVALLVTAIVVSALAVFVLIGLYMVEPNQSAVLSLFGRYVGTVQENGLRWSNPFFTKRKISLRIRNFESGKLKVNELDGSPIEIAAVIVWKVVDSAEAVFNVDDYESFVHIQSEAALRAMATSYPYDQHEDDQMSLRSHPLEISNELKLHLDERLASCRFQGDLLKQAGRVGVIDPDEVVLEVKFDSVLPPQIRCLLEDIPKARSAISKYCLCCSVL